MLGKHSATFYHCDFCGFLCAEHPYWLDESYKEPINSCDTGYLKRNIDNANKVTILIHLLFNKHEKFLDYGGGYGVFVRLMRDIGLDFYWNDFYAENIFAKGFEGSVKGERYEAVTLFECFEHFVDPLAEIYKILEISKSIIFTTNILPVPIRNPHDWWYYGIEHGQHVSFYERRTLKYIAEKNNLKYSSAGNFHVFSEYRINDLIFKILTIRKIGLQNIFTFFTKSKTWEDYLKTRKLNENIL